MQSTGYFCQILIELEAPGQIFKKPKNPQQPHFVKIHPVGAELFRVDGQADMIELTVAFRNFVNIPNKEIH
jgi:hypothetical protein